MELLTCTKSQFLIVFRILSFISSENIKLVILSIKWSLFLGVSSPFYPHMCTQAYASSSTNSYLNSPKIQLGCRGVFRSSGTRYSNPGCFTSLHSQLLESSSNINQEKPGLMSRTLELIGRMVKHLLWGQAMFLSSAWVRNFPSDL